MFRQRSSMPLADSRPEVHDLASAKQLFASIADAPREVAAFGYLCAAGRLIGLRYIHGLEDAIDLHPRTVVMDALVHDAAAVLMAHNHPSGDPTPSPADVALSKRIARALESLDIHLVDHLVIADGAVRSVRALGLL
jgi:DNA repair protein RadC